MPREMPTEMLTEMPTETPTEMPTEMLTEIPTEIPRKYTSDEEDLLKILLPRYRSDFRGLADAWERVFMARGEFEGVVYNIDRRSLAQLKSKAQHIAGAETKSQKAVTRSDTATQQAAQQPSQRASQAPHSPPPSQPPPSPPRTTTETDSQCLI